MLIGKLLTRLIVICTSCSQFLSAIEFDFQPLASLCRIEVQLSTSFGNGSVHGKFGKMAGKIDFSPENPSNTAGNLVLSSRSLRFGYPKVAHDTHTQDWLDSSKYPQISFKMQKMTDFSWHGSELRADAIGVLKIKDVEKKILIPMSIHYFRGERRKYDGKSGDLLRIQGLISLPRSEFGLATGELLGSVMEEIEIMISLTGASNQTRPFLPSHLFAK